MKHRSVWLGGESGEPVEASLPIIKIEAPDVDDNASYIKGSENTISFYGEVNSVTAGEISRLLTETDIRLQNTKNILGEEYTPTIHLKIRSDGGSLFEGLAILDRMRTIKSKIYTYVEGGAASAATLISVAGNKRYIGKDRKSTRLNSSH